MKFKLPLMLRAALLSCFAAASTAFTSTFTTGTIAAGTVAYVLTQQQAQADVRIYNAAGDTGDTISGLTAESNEFIIFNVVPNETGGQYLYWTSSTWAGAPIYVYDWGISAFSGGSQKVYTFNGAILDYSHLAEDLEGTGFAVPTAEALQDADGARQSNNIGFYRTGDDALNTDATNYHPVKYVFNGQMSEFSGNIVSYGTAMELAFGIADGVDQAERNSSAAGRGHIIVGGRTVDFTMTGAVTVNNASITVSNTIEGAAVNAGGKELNPHLTFGGGAMYAVSSSITADLLTVAAGTRADFSANVTSATTQNFNGETNFSGASNRFQGTTNIAAAVSLLNGTTTFDGTISVGAGSITVAADADITINGTLSSNKLINNAGTITFGADARIDLSQLTGVNNVYTLFEGAGTLVGFDGLELTGITSSGYNVLFDADAGTITLALDGSLHNYAGGTINWAEGSAFEAGKFFADGDSVAFTAGTSDVAMTESINAGFVKIDAGATLELSSANGTEQLMTEQMLVDGSVVLEGDVLADDVVLTSSDPAAAGTVRFALGAGNALNYETQLDTFTGAVVVESGTLQFTTGAKTADAAFRDISVEAGATLLIHDIDMGVDINLEGGADAATKATLDMAYATYTGLLTATGETAFTSDDLVYLSGGLAGSGTLTVNTTNSLHLISDSTHTGTLSIESGELVFGSGGGDLQAVNFERMIINTGGSIYYQSAAVAFNTIQMNGGTLHVFDMNDNTASVARLEVTANSSVLASWNSQWSISELTGDGDLSFGASGGNTEQMVMTIGQINDYHGTMDFQNNAGRYDLAIGAVNQSEGKTGSITNLNEAVTATSFSMKGAGSFTVGGDFNTKSAVMEHTGSFTVTGMMSTNSFQHLGAGNTELTGLTINNNGTLHMNYNGSVTGLLGADLTLQLSSNAVLSYGAPLESLFNLNAANVTDIDTLTISVLDVNRATLAAGIDLGISSDILKDNLDIFGLSESQYTLVVDTTTQRWKLTVAEAEVFGVDDWDINWGAAELAKAPATIIATDAIVGTAGAMDNIYLYNQDSPDGTPYTQDDVTAINLTGGGRETVGVNTDAISVYAGAYDVAVTTNSWINVTGGEFFIIGGATISGDFVGSSHIVLNQTSGTVDYIVGGNNQDGGGSSFTGDSYISIYSNTLNGSLIGGSTNMHSNTTTFTGNTNIFIYTPLNLTTTDAIHNHGAGNLGANQIIGSNSWGANVSTSSVHNGNSNITVDLVNYSGAAAEFTKNIMGASYIDRANNYTMTGDIYVTITGHENVTFKGAIRGGSYLDEGTSTRNGTATLVINGNGSTFDGRIVGADDIGAGGTSTSTINNATFVTINGGTYNNVIIGGFNQHNHNSISSDLNLTITSGDFNESVMAGSFQDAGSNTVNGDINLTINGGNFATSVYGGSSGSSGVKNASTNTVTGKHNLHITGGSFGGVLVGGTGIGGPLSGKVDSQGGVNMIIEGGDFNGNIIGGHNRINGADAASALQLMGDVSITLTGGNVGSNVYAAGWNSLALAAGAVFSTKSTKVTIGSGVVFDGSNQIIDGSFGGAGAASGTVTNGKTLAFNSATAYANLDSITFQNFDTIEVIEGASVAIALNAGTITKTGLGILELGSQNHDSLSVNAGTLKLTEGSATSTLTAVHVSSAATLDLTNTNVGISGALNLTGTAGLSMTADNAIALGELHLNLDAGEKLTLNLNGAVLSGTYNYTLFTGLSEDTITGIDFTLQTGQMAAAAGDYLEGYSGFLVRNGDGSISLVNSLVSEQIWGGGNGNINDENWTNGSVEDQAFIDELSYTFNSSTGDVRINTAVDAYDFSIAGAGVSYNFSADPTGSLVVDTLSVAGGARANFTMDNLDLTDAQISIEASSTLVFGQSETLGSLSSTGTLDAGTNDITLNTATTSGGSLAAANLILAAGDNSFAQLSISGTVTNTGILSVGGTSTIQSLSGGGLAVVGASSTLTLSTATTLSSFGSEGSVTANAGLTITNKVTQGGTLNVGTLGLSKGGSFTQLRAGAVTNTSGVVSVGGTSTMSSLSGGGLEVREYGTLTLDAATSITTLNNLGSIISTGALSISAGGIVGGILTVGTAATNANLTLSSDANASNTFSKLTVNGNVVGHGGTLTLGDGSRITGSLNGGALVTSGDVSIGSNASGVRSLSNATGTLSMGGNLSVGTSGFLNEGIIDVTGTITLLAQTDQGGHLEATGNVTLAGASNTFSSINTDGTITGTEALSVSASSSATSVGEMALTVNGDASVMTLSTDDSIVLTSLNGTGSLELTGNSALTLKAASSGKDLSVTSGNLTLGGALSLSGTLSVSVPQLALTLDYDPDINTPAISTATLGASKLNLNITDDQLRALGLSNITTYTLVDVDTALNNTFELAFSTSGNTEYQLDGTTSYTLSLNGDGDIIISVSISGNEWNGAVGSQWDDSVDNWTIDLPDTSQAAFFFGAGISTVEVVGSQTAMQMQVSSAAHAEGKYSFSGGNIATEQLLVTSGAMDMSNSITVAGGVNFEGNTGVSGNAALNILAGGSLTTDSLSLAADGQLSVADGASLNVGKNGVTVLGTGSISNEGSITIAGDSDISNLDGSGTLTIDGDANLQFDHLSQSSLVIEEGSTLTIKENGTITITGAVTNSGTIDGSAAGTTINVTANALEGGNISTDTLTVADQGARFEDVRANIIQLTGELTAGALVTRSAPTPLLIANSVTSLDAGKIILDVDHLSASLGVGTYYLVDTTDTLTWDMVDLDADTRSELNKLIYSGKDITYSSDNSSLSFNVTEASERRWLMSNNYAASGSYTPGSTPNNAINPIVDSSQTTGLTEGSIVSNDILDSVQFVFLDVDYTLKFDQVGYDATAKPEGLVIRNLSGASNKTLTLEGDGVDLDKATLSNDRQSTVDNIVLKGMSVDVVAHHDAGKLFVDQTLTVDNSALTIKDGGELELGSMTLAAGAATVEKGELIANTVTLDTASQLSVQEGATVELGSLTTAGDAALSFDGGSSMIDELALKGDATLAVTGADTSVIVKDISSSETSKITGHVQLGGGDYTGTYGTTGAILEVLANATASMVTGTSLSLKGNSGSIITLNTSAAAGNKLASIATTNSTLTLTENGVELSQSSTMTGGTLSFKLDSTEVAEMLNTNTAPEQIFTNTSQLTLNGVNIVLGQSDSNSVLDIRSSTDTTSRVIASINGDGNASSELSVTLSGPAFSKYFTNARYENGNLVADLNTESYTDKVSTANGKAGASLLGGALIALNPQWLSAGATESKYPDLADVLNALDKATGDQADNLAAAVAGASVNLLGGSMLSAVDCQLQNVRNRAKTASTNPMTQNDRSFWISAEGGLNQVDAKGTASGYDYSSFGGSLGVDMTLDESVTLGLAATALYGSLEASGPDTATGDLNTYALSAYARVTNKRWNHSFVLTASMAEGNLNRTVNYDGGSYESHGDTEGMGFGLLYELGYTYMLDEEKTTRLQPVFNISFVHAGIDGYTEEGSDASLIVGDQDSSYVSVGLGSRYETAIGETIFNRIGVFSLRAMVKADAGDRFTSADVSLVNNAGVTRSVEGAEVGALGIELGAGLNIPVGIESGTMYMDASVELRDGQNSVNATVGYSFSF